MNSNTFRFAVGKSLFGLLLLSILTPAAPASAQEVTDTIRVNTRVVFMDALVKDKRTGLPISDLKPENFEVLDEGKARPISYFSREGEARKPLALVLILDLRQDGAGRFLKRAEILEMMATELAKLPPGDEVAIMAVNFDGDGGRKMLTDFTRDKNLIAAALRQVPELLEPEGAETSSTAEAIEKAFDGIEEVPGGVNLERTKTNNDPVPGQAEVKTMPENPNPSEKVEAVETYKDPKTGVTIIRTIMKDGTVATRRMSKSGNVNIDIDERYSLYAAAREVSRIATVQRPNSQAAIVWVTDGIIPIIIEDRNATADLLVRSNVTFNSLTVSMKTLFKFLLPFAKPIGNMIGVSFSGSAKFLAKESGGEAVQVNRTSDYGRGLSKIIGNLTARYSLGFTLAEEEKDDGRLHNLEIRVKATDAKGKARKLEVNARRGYYMTISSAKETTTAAKVQ